MDEGIIYNLLLRLPINIVWRLLGINSVVNRILLKEQIWKEKCEKEFSLLPEKVDNYRLYFFIRTKKVHGKLWSITEKEPIRSRVDQISSNDQLILVRDKVELLKEQRYLLTESVVQIGDVEWENNWVDRTSYHQIIFRDTSMIIKYTLNIPIKIMASFNTNDRIISHNNYIDCYYTITSKDIIDPITKKTIIAAHSFVGLRYKKSSLLDSEDPLPSDTMNRNNGPTTYKLPYRFELYATNVIDVCLITSPYYMILLNDYRCMILNAVTNTIVKIIDTDRYIAIINGSLYSYTAKTDIQFYKNIFNSYREPYQGVPIRGTNQYTVNNETFTLELGIDGTGYTRGLSKNRSPFDYLDEEEEHPPPMIRSHPITNYKGIIYGHDTMFIADMRINNC